MLSPSALSPSGWPTDATRSSVTSSEAAELESLRNSLGLGHRESLQITGDLSRDAYLSALRRTVLSGPVTSAAKADLHRLKRALALSHAAASEMIRDEAKALYRECFTFAVQVGTITKENLETLQWLQLEAGLSNSDVKSYIAKLRKIERLAMFRAGQLPSVMTRALLESGEICHWEGRCTLPGRCCRSAWSPDVHR
jgi:Chloroplast envelope transporter